MKEQESGVKRQKNRVKERRGMVELESVEENDTLVEMEQISKDTHLN